MARVQFDHGPLKGGTEFADPIRRITADDPQDVPDAFDALQRAQEDGYWLAGYASYELGYVLCDRLAALLPVSRSLPLLNFGVFDAPGPLSAPADPQSCTLETPRPLWDFDRYARAFRRVHDFICAGDIYQANLTLPMTARFAGSQEALYAALRTRQPVPHGCFVDLEGPTLLSRSPELFFALNTNGQLTARPMKGTAPRGANAAEDDALRRGLQRSEKNRAENLMIVDLLRNDLSRISEIGSVKVPDLFEVERYDTLHQMTSRVTSRLRKGTTIGEIFTALFPCGSITGAPKIRAMEILRDLETGPRDAYCGSIGWIAPDGSMQFNVAIRTLTCRPGGRVDFNVGGGIVHDSTVESEYAEALLKSTFVQSIVQIPVPA